MKAIETMRQEFLDELGEWAEMHSSLDKGRMKSIVCTSMAIFGKESLITQKAYNQLAMLIFGIDDIYDSFDFSSTELRSIKSFFLRQGPLMTGLSQEKLLIVRDLDNTLHEILDDTRFSLSINGRFYQCLLEQIGRVLTGMLAEAERKATASPVTIEQYLETGRCSVAAIWVFLVILYLIDKEYFRNDDGYAPVITMLEISGEAIRLMNDQRTHARESLENKVNSISIAQNSIPGYRSLSAALKYVDGLIEERQRRLRHLVNASQNSAFKRLGQIIILAVEVFREFYGRQDFK
jgi:hypothetical protein